MWREESYRLLSLLSTQLVMLKWIFSDYECRLITEKGCEKAKNCKEYKIRRMCRKQKR